jgi:N-acetylmuramoyl-L-alanine amidase
MTPPPETGAEAELLARLVWAEARGEPFRGQVAVAAVVLNRVADPRWPNTVEEVVFEPGQFCGSHSLPENVPQNALRAAEKALQGLDPSRGSYYFSNDAEASCWWIRTRETVVVIGNHTFAK